MSQNLVKILKCLFIYITVILIGFESVFSSFLPYDFRNDGEVGSVVFSSEDDSEGLLGQLYLQKPSSQVIFQLKRRDNDNQYNRNLLVNQYASQGIYPTIMFLNASWNTSLELDEFVQNQENAYWTRNITVTELFYEPKKYSLRRYDYIAELGKGLNLFECRGSVIIQGAEPLLNLQFGDSVDTVPLNSNPDDLILRSSPCSSLIAGVVPVVNVSESPNSGKYLCLLV